MDDFEDIKKSFDTDEEAKELARKRALAKLRRLHRRMNPMHEPAGPLAGSSEPEYMLNFFRNSEERIKQTLSIHNLPIEERLIEEQRLDSCQEAIRLEEKRLAAKQNNQPYDYKTIKS